MKKLLPCLFLVGCAQPATYVVGEDLTQLVFVPYSPDEGVYPDVSVLTDPNNPFAGGIGPQTKWDVLASGPVHGFYAMATALTAEPTGEHQLYTASSLQRIYEDELAAPEDLWLARDLAVRGYRSVLDNFTADVTFDASGTFSWPVAPLAFEGLRALGGDTSGFALLTTDDGQQVVVATP